MHFVGAFSVAHQFTIFVALSWAPNVGQLSSSVGVKDIFSLLTPATDAFITFFAPNYFCIIKRQQPTAHTPTHPLTHPHTPVHPLSVHLPCLPVILIILQLFAHNSCRLLPKNNRKFPHRLKREQRVVHFSYSSSDLGRKAAQAGGETQVKSGGGESLR